LIDVSPCLERLPQPYYIWYLASLEHQIDGLGATFPFSKQCSAIAATYTVGTTIWHLHAVESQGSGEVLLNQASFKATHNSYSGDIAGERCGIVSQLDRQIRLIELDIHAADFGAAGDYQIGHDGGPGDQVWHRDGNPQSNRFQDWLAQIATWSRSRRGHAPLQIVLDMKESFDLPSAAEGNFGALNEILLQCFGSTLLVPGSVGEWPDVDVLRGRVIVTLSGSQDGREAYLRDYGANPSVAANSKGQLIEVHESQAGNHSLWYWTGVRQCDGSVTWKKHGRYGTGTAPAVAINDDGWIVEVHKSQNHDRLWYQTGRLTAGLDVIWNASHDYDNGVLPTIRFQSLAGVSLREIHRSQAHAQNWQWNVTLNTGDGTLVFADNVKTMDPRWPFNRCNDLVVGITEHDRLVYSTAHVDRGSICYEQVAFVEYQSGEPDWLRIGARIGAAAASDDGALTEMRTAGMVTRGWQFSAGSPHPQPPDSYPATDTPYEAWYDNYCAAIGVVS
jgi:hypothetical protein